MECRKPILLINSFWSKLYAYDIKNGYKLLYSVALQGWQKHPCTFLKSSGLLVYSAAFSTLNAQEKFLYVWNVDNKWYLTKIKIAQDSEVHNMEHYAKHWDSHNRSMFMMEDERVLKIRKLVRKPSMNSELEDEEKTSHNQFEFEDIKTWEFDELKNKKAIFMNDTGSKVFYRVQNMGVIYWDYFTGETRKIRVEIPDCTFYSAYSAFDLVNNQTYRWYAENATNHWAFIAVDWSGQKYKKKFLVYNLDTQEVLCELATKKSKVISKKWPRLIQKSETLMMYGWTQPLRALENYSIVIHNPHETEKSDKNIINIKTPILTVQDSKGQNGLESNLGVINITVSISLT